MPATHSITDRHADRLLERRGRAERLVHLARHLHADDRAMIRGVLEMGLSATELARVINRPPRTVRRAVSRLIKRLESPEFLFILRRRDSWPDQRRAVAEKLYLQGLSQRQIARDLDISLHQVRREAADIRLLIEQQKLK